MAARGPLTNVTRFPDVDRVVAVIARLCQLRFFRHRFFPRACLRQSLVLYRMLNRMGYPARIHFGVQKNGSVFEGHSWVTLNGKPLGERAPQAKFATVYSHPLAEAVR